jgi:N-acetylneuraminic acid mutarotase
LLLLAAAAAAPQEPSRWKVLAGIPDPQLGCGGAVLNGKFHVLGGATLAGGASDAHQVYDPATNTWTRKAPIPEKAGWPAVAVHDGRIYLFGGDRKGIDAQQSDRAFAYDPATDSWRELARLPAPRSYAAARAIGGAIYIFGARTLHSDTVDLTTYRYDPKRNTYTRMADLPEGARFITQGEYNGYIYCIHGETADETYADGVLKYDIARNAWSKLNIPRINKTKWTLSQHSANISFGSKLFILGGKPPEGKRTPAATFFDMAAERFGVADPMPKGRCCGASGVVDGTIYSAGGFWEQVEDVVVCRETWGYRIPKTLALKPAGGCCGND